ncbi:MAG: hypothetical protein HC906_04580 [Bacteroidales bacterium]|nr:hypothetical protein [Bacteroidales bacterium]
MTTYWLGGREKMPVNPKDASRIPDPEMSIDKLGTNAFVYYDVNKNIHFELAGGYQNSRVNASILGNSDHPIIERDSKSQYIDFRSTIFGFHLQLNQMWGEQDIQKSVQGWYVSPTTRNASVEYEKTILGSLTLRPGISYQQAIYDDQKHLSAEALQNHWGFLNGAPELTAVSGYLRSDYKAFEKLRIIAALRADKYNVPNKTYLTYQFIGSFDINKTNVVRAVYSRANRGPFIVDSYADYTWLVVSEEQAALQPSTMYPNTSYWFGNKNLKLPVIDMIELGYRTQPVKNMMIDIEAFRTTTSHYSYFLPDTFSVTFDFLKQLPASATSYVRYYNFDMKTIQTGLTANVSMVINPQLKVRIFGTLQTTELKNVYYKTLWECYDDMAAINTAKIMADGTILTIASGALVAQNAQIAGLAQSAVAKIAGGQTPSDDEMNALTAYQQAPETYNNAAAEYLSNPTLYNNYVSAYQNFTPDQLTTLGTIIGSDYKKTYGTRNTDLIDGKINPDSLVNLEHKATPKFYGGFDVEFNPASLKKMSVYLGSYFYSENILYDTKINDIGRYNLDGSAKTNYDSREYSSVYTVEPKIILNLKISYKVWKECSVFINTRNLLNTSKREFGYLDEIKGLYLLGMNLKF